MKYRKKPIIVEAIIVEVGYHNLKEITEFVGAENLCPIERKPNYVLKIKTLEGDMAVNYGDYIVKGVEGEFYPVKPSIFEATYEKLDDRLMKPAVRKRDGNHLYLTPEALEIADGKKDS